MLEQEENSLQQERVPLLQQEVIDEQIKLLNTHRRTLAHYLAQQAILGSAHTPPSVTHGIREACNEILRIKETLRQHQVVVQDHPDDNQCESPAQLFANHYIDPWPIFDRVNLSQYVGRSWILQEIDSFLESNDQGYFILEAEAGLGKTTFLAWLVQQRAYIHHFADLMRGSASVERTIKNLAVQLIRKYNLDSSSALNLPSDADGLSDYLLELLKQASEQRRAMEKIVLVIDALDEAGTPTNRNVLGLPRSLPGGVIMIVSHRPVPIKLEIETPSTPYHRFELIAEAPNNRADTYKFLERALLWPGVAEAVSKSELPSSQIKSILQKKCGGIWIYLYHITAEIEHQRQLPRNLNTLPAGLTQYFIHYWSSWRNSNEEQWYKCHLPLLGTLAATRDPVNAKELFGWAGVDPSDKSLKRLLNERWRPFLAVTGSAQHRRYQFYHATLREFFEGKADSSQLSVAERAFVEELGEATLEAHGRIIHALRQDIWHAPKEAARRDAAFRLIHMDWLAYADDVSPDEIEEILNLIARYIIDSPDPRRYLLRHIDSALKLDLSDRQRAHLLVYAAAMHGRLDDLSAAAKHYDKAKALISRLIVSPDQQASDIKLSARISLGLANIACIQAEQLTEPKYLEQQQQTFAAAVALYKQAARAAHTYGQDIQLELTILKELIYTYALLADWDEAEKIDRVARNILTSSALREQDPIAYTVSLAQLLETASQMHFQKAQSLSSNEPNAEAFSEYMAAYKIAQEEIGMLTKELEATGAPVLIHDLALAHINAGDYLLEINSYNDHTVDRPLASACQHWRIASDLAHQHDIPEQQENATERLALHCDSETD